MNTTDMRNHPDALTVEDDSTSPVRFYHLATWSHPRADDFAPLWSAANDARGALRGYFVKRRDILANARLSAAAQQDDIREAALVALRELGGYQRRLNDAVERIDARRLKLADVAPADAATTVLDVAIGDYLRSLQGVQGDARERFLAGLVSGAEPRAVEAVLRLPTFLTGLSPELLAVVHKAAIERAEPQEVLKLDQLAKAVGTAQHVLTRAFELISGSVSLQLGETIRAAGSDAWKALVKMPTGDPEVAAAIARRHLADASA